MADFFSDLFDSITGKQATPQQTITDPAQLYSQGIALAQGAIPALTSYNTDLAKMTGQTQLGYEQLINPYANDVRTGAYKSILDQLNLGTELPADLQQQVVRGALSGNAASGFGVSQGGRGLVAADLGLTGLDLQNRRTNNALSAANALPLTQSKFTPYGGLSPVEGAQAIQENIAAKDNLANLTENIRRQNFSSLINTGGRIAGTVIGGIYGGAAGASIGGQVGGSVLGSTGVAGYGNSSGGGGGGGGFGGLTSLLSGIFSGGGGGGGGGAISAGLGGGIY